VEVQTGRKKTMAAPTFTLRQLMEAGVHFGHNTRRWNPKMAPFLFGARNGVHIIDLDQTRPMLYRALEAITATVSKGGRILFVGTKRAASEKVAESAQRCGQYYVNHRWPGGMLTNWKTISQSIKRMRDIEGTMESEDLGKLSKKEALMMSRDHEKLMRTLNGIRDMGGLPDMIFVLDTNKEHLAVAEAKVLGIPVVAVIDSNSDPDSITFPVPGNDDALRAIDLYCDLVADAVLEGLQVEVTASGADLGASAEAPVESALGEGAAAEEAPAEDAAPAAEEAPAEEAAPAAEEVSAEEVAPAAEEAPAEEVAPAAEEAPAEATPAEEAAPAEEAPAKKPAAKKAPAKKAAADGEAAEKAPAKKAAAKKPAAKKAPAKKAAAEKADD
jgi:small subunit ribosomal protein S2